MTVLRVDTTDIHAGPRPQNSYAGIRGRGGFADPASPQIQSWARGMEIRSVKRRHVIAEKKHPLPVFSSEGIRWDMLIIAFSLILLLFAGILVSDVSALYAGSSRISGLSTGIASLEQSNIQLREELSREQAARTFVRKTEDEGPGRIVILSPAPEE